MRQAGYAKFARRIREHWGGVIREVGVKLDEAV